MPIAEGMARMARHWVLDQEAVSVVFTGVSRPGQAVNTASLLCLPPLRRDSHEGLAGFYREGVEHQIRGPYRADGVAKGLSGMPRTACSSSIPIEVTIPGA